MWDGFPYVFLYFFPPNHKISWQGSSHFASFSTPGGSAKLGGRNGRGTNTMPVEGAQRVQQVKEMSCLLTHSQYIDGVTGGERMHHGDFYCSLPGGVHA